MKVAYNSCYGGFGLSPLAETEYRAKKGITLTWYEGVGGYPYESFKKLTDPARIAEKGRSIMSLSACTKDLGDEVEKIPDGVYFYESWYDSDRSDPDLIEIIERLGDKANGYCASLAIKEIPDGSEFEITEYDGNEEVVPPRMSWDS